MPEPINVFVPCRAGSQRVPNKNTRPIGPFRGGLIDMKLTQLSRAPSVDSIVVSTDDPKVEAIAKEHQVISDKTIHILGRPPELATADSLDAFLAWVPTIMPEGVTAWTHVTSPLFDDRAMEDAIAAFRTHVERGPFDSLMSVTALRSFLWNNEGCLSHNREVVKWPQTQDLDPIFEVNSALFMISNASMRAVGDRIGAAPYLLEVSEREGFDIDWPIDFEIAEYLLSKRVRDFSWVSKPGGDE